MRPRFSSRSNKTKTWFLMLGIAAVVGLDLGFTLLVGSESAPNVTLDSPITRSKVVQSSDISPEPAQPETSQDVSVSKPPAEQVIESRPRLNSSRPDAAPIVQRQVIVAADRKRDRPPSQPGENLFAPKTVRPQYAARSSPLTFGPYAVTTSDNIRFATADVKRSKNNSLASRLSPVVKKPWQWMKSLVSKLR